MGKNKEAKEPEAAEGGEGPSYEAKTKFCSVIANPLADEKLCKKVLKLCKKASKRKAIRRGVKEVVKALRKKQKG
jgi:H/ACA ribonucleoprotein complex subunit 2